MLISQFINFIDEIVDDENNKILEKIIKTYVNSNKQDYKIDKKEIDIILIKIFETLAALSMLQLYKEQQEHENRELIQYLNCFEQTIKACEVDRRQQHTITSYFLQNFVYNIELLTNT